MICFVFSAVKLFVKEKVGRSKGLALFRVRAGRRSVHLPKSEQFAGPLRHVESSWKRLQRGGQVRFNRAPKHLSEPTVLTGNRSTFLYG